MLRPGSSPAGSRESRGRSPSASSVWPEAAGRAPSADRAATPRPSRCDGIAPAPRATAPRMPACREIRYAGSPLARLLQLLNLPDDQVALDPAQPIDEDDAVEVIHFVLEGARQQARSFDRLLGAVTRQSLEDRALGPDDGGVEAGRAEAAFLFELRAFAFDERGVHHHDQ